MASHDDLPFSHALRPSLSGLSAEQQATRLAFRGVVSHTAAVRRVGVDIESIIAALTAPGRPSNRLRRIPRSRRGRPARRSVNANSHCLCESPARHRRRGTRRGDNQIPQGQDISSCHVCTPAHLRLRPGWQLSLNLILKTIPRRYSARTRLVSPERAFLPFLCFYFCPQSVFFSDMNHTGKIPLRAAVTSPVMAEWLRLSDAPAPGQQQVAGRSGESGSDMAPYGQSNLVLSCKCAQEFIGRCVGVRHVCEGT